MPRGIAWVWWVATLIAMIVGWPERWLRIDATSLRAVVERAIEEPSPRLIVTIEVLEEGIGLPRRGVLVEVGMQHVGSIPWLHLRAARRGARGPPLVPRRVVDEVHDRENPDPKEKTC